MGATRAARIAGAVAASIATSTTGAARIPS